MSSRTRLDPSALRRLRYVAAILAVLVAAVHLYHPSHGVVGLVIYARAGTLGDPRPLAFTLGGLAILFGLLLAYNGVARRPLYLGGIVVVGGFFVGFFAWHTVLEHGAFWPHLEPIVHDVGTVQVIVDHLLRDRLALLAKLLEVATLIVLSVLYVSDRPAE